MSRPRRLNSSHEQVANWLAFAGADDVVAFRHAVAAIEAGDDQVLERMNCRSLPWSPPWLVLELGHGLVLTWAPLVDYPDYFNIHFVGHLDL